MNTNVERPVAFVTGAGSGIGKATALLFARKGYATVLADLNEAAGRDMERALRDDGHEAAFFVTNVADDASIEAAVAGAVDRFGRIDAAFNAAGIDGEFGKLTADCSVENWQRVLTINLTGIWLSMRHQIPQMLKNGGGAIVNCSSSAGLRGAATCAAYAAAKHGVVGLTKTAALEYAAQNIRINAVCPGMIDTPMTRKEGMSDLLDAMVLQTPLGRFGRPEEIAAAVFWLCSDAAGFVHGQAIPVDGAVTSR